MPKFVLGISLLRCDELYGYNHDLKTINSHYMVYTTIDLSEFYDYSYTEYIDVINKNISWINTHTGYDNNIIRNYNNIITKEDFVKINILQVTELDSGDSVATIKTPYLNILQRKWKNIYHKRQLILKERKKLSSLKHREIYGVWK